MNEPNDELLTIAEATAPLHASRVAVRVFRQGYEQTRMAGLAAPIGEIGK